jgi:hypothetical protein
MHSVSQPRVGAAGREHLATPTSCHITVRLFVLDEDYELKIPRQYLVAIATRHYGHDELNPVAEWL